MPFRSPWTVPQRDFNKSMLATVNHHPSLLANTTVMASVKTAFTLAAIGAVTLLTGCTSMEQKLGRGIANVIEPIRGGEFTRSTEQTFLADGPVVAQSYGYVHGISRMIQRTAVGAFDILTFPIPTDPLIQPSEPVFPDSFKPQMAAGLGYGADDYIGFQGGGVLPFIAGSDFNPLSN